MARFNQNSHSKTANLAGGVAYAQSKELELISILLTSFAADQFYRSASDTFDRLKYLLKRVDPKLAAQAAVYARTRFGMRSISHVLASELAKHISGEPWAKSFFEKVIYRPDDLMEIISYHKNHNGKLTNSMKKGFARAFDKFNAYQLAKYRGEGKAVKLVDVVNLVHPKPTDSNAEALHALVNGKLRSTETWEAQLTQAGQKSETEQEKQQFKAKAWKSLILERKLGYFALLRNLRNIALQAPDVLDEALEMLVDEKLIRKSLVLPFRYATAYEEIRLGIKGKKGRRIMAALSEAVDISIANCPVFEGDTLVVLDVSGSMVGKPSQIGSLFAAILMKSNNADFMTFSDQARYENLNYQDSTMSIANSIRFAAGGTNFKAIFAVANQSYDRVIILSDMQGWVDTHYHWGNVYSSPVQSFNRWKKLTGANPFVYSFDLSGYGTLQYPEQNVFCLAGFSEKIFDVMKLLETDKQALISEIRKVEL
jgi:60 kDa SS-A/Ro ribonucleoprotein